MPPTEAPATTPELKPGQTPTTPPPDPNAPAPPAAVEFASRYLARGKKPDVEPQEPEEGDKPKAKAKSKPAQKAEPKREAPKPAAIDEEKLGRAIGESVSKALKPAEKPKEEPTKDESIPPAEARRLKVFKQMEELWPDQYKGFSEKYRTNMRKLREYAANWEKANPGKKFDESDDDHAEFIAALEAEVEYEDDDYTEALAEIKFKEREAGTKKEPDPELEKLNQRLSKFERQEKILKQEPIIAAQAAEAGNEFWKIMGDNYAKVVNPDGSINQEALIALKTEDEDVYNDVVRAATATEHYAREIHLLENGLIDFDGVKNPAHKYLSDSALAAEEKMSKRDPEKQLDDSGRPFVSKAQWNKLSTEERQKVWTFTEHDLAFIVAEDIAKSVKARLKEEEEKFTRRAKAKGLMPEKPQPPKREEHPMANKLRKMMGQEEEPEEVEDDKPDSPSTPIVPREAPRRPAGNTPPKGTVESFISRAIHGR